MSGWIVDRRDQVRITFLSLAAFIASIFVIRCVSMNGPFLVERAIAYLRYFCARYNESREEPSRLGFALLHSASLLTCRVLLRALLFLATNYWQLLTCPY